MIFRAPADPNSDLVKRCIGLPGDTIEMVAVRLYVNGQEVKSEPYASYRTDLPGYASETSGRATSSAPSPCPPDEFFFLGDNRNNSLDSRFWGIGAAPLHQGPGLADLLVASAAKPRTVSGPTSATRLQQIRQDPRRLLHRDPLVAHLPPAPLAAPWLCSPAPC